MCVFGAALAMNHSAAYAGNYHVIERDRGPLVLRVELLEGPRVQGSGLGRDAALQGTTDWTTLQASAGNAGGSRLLEATLQLHIDGPGTVWVDDVKLINRHTY